MNYRPHQARLAEICNEILTGAPIRQIIAAVTPGGGKSKLPVILADMLIPSFADKVFWVVPRNSLKYQGEAEFLDRRFPTTKRMRAADGNENDPCRGTDGYLTTYQAIGQSPECHLKFCRKHRTILFLDEGHHVADDKAWADAIAPMREAAVLTIDASGTLARGDGQKIHGLEYDGLHVDLSAREHIRIIQYTRSQAIRDGAILPIHFNHLDGRAEWEDEQGERRQSDSLAGTDYASAALFTALRTEYAYELLDECVTDWRRYRASAYPAGKLLVVSPSIEYAQLYQAHLHRRHIDALIATSDDSSAARSALDRFKGLSLPTSNALVTCQLAYEGLSVPSITHIACLTHIRSMPWLEQCFARGNRTAPEKREAFVYGPADTRLLEAIRSIEAEQVQALSDRASAFGEGGGSEGGEGSGGGGRPTIRPIGSAAYRAGGMEILAPEVLADKPDGGMTPREAERLLRQQIARHIEIKLDGVRAGSKAAYSKIIHARLKEIAGGKAREDCTVEELTAQWAWLKEKWPV